MFRILYKKINNKLLNNVKIKRNKDLCEIKEDLINNTG